MKMLSFMNVTAYPCRYGLRHPNRSFRLFILRLFITYQLLAITYFLLNSSIGLPRRSREAKTGPSA
jgi:hypothetical protein